MASTFKFELVSPERILLSLDADQVVVPGVEGDFAVLAGHAPFISTLRPGIIDVTSGGFKSRLLVKAGIAEVEPERLTILAQTAYDVDELTPTIIADEVRTAEAELAAATDDIARMNANTLLGELRRLTSRAA